MPASTQQLGMFHRRLALILAGASLALLPVGAQLARLTLVRGSDLRAQAEQPLIARILTPTSRGRILDRKGRVLAKDRPSFDVAVDYDIIAGGEAWARTRAGIAARRLYRDQWPGMTPDERRATIAALIPPFLAHLDEAWDRLAQACAVDPEELQRRREEILIDVDHRYNAVVNKRLAQELEAQLAMGREMTTDIESDIQKRATRDIEEQKARHPVLPRVPDTVAFNLQRLLDQRTKVLLPPRDPNAEPFAVDVPLLPGVAVTPSGDREYPLERLTVIVDRSTLPAPLRAQSVARIPVEGVAYHLLGRTRPDAFANEKRADPRDIDPATGKPRERTILGHAALRRERLAADPAFAARVLTPASIGAIAQPFDRGEYQDGDPAGLSGVEESREGELRGLRGVIVEQRETGQRLEIPPEPGRDTTLTIDAMLQARVQAAMTPELGLAVAQPWHGKENPTVPVGTSLNGAAVVLDVDSGDILAMVSTPTISRDALKNSRALFNDPLNKDVDLPWLDRTITRPYPPGSIAKALILTGAVTLGRTTLDAPIDCTGHLFPGEPDKFRCWIYKQFHNTHTAYLGHALSAPEALMVSCNIYFYTLGQRLGPEGIARTYQMFGLGEPMPLGLERPRRDADTDPTDDGSARESAVFPGYLGTRSNIPARATSPGTIGPQDAIQMAIGQGPVAWTPLHAADAYATLARGGVRLRPRLIEGTSAPPPEDLHLDPRAIAQALEGLSASVNDERGTGHHLSHDNGEREPHFNAPGVRVWGKTGTATAPTIYVGPDDPLYESAPDALTLGLQTDNLAVRAPAGKHILRAGDHSWFVVLVGRTADNRPRYAIAVMMEYAGSGGKVSGPIVNQIIHALIAEGYL